MPIRSPRHPARLPARISGDSVNFVNAPVVLERLGVKMEVVKSTDEVRLHRTHGVEAIAADGSVHSAKGTFIGKTATSRASSSINGREVEVEAEGKLLVIENLDQPGMIGTIGTLLGKDGVNIANMSLSRQSPAARR
jgi:D-3-phosphoglycerate dehydrogenase